MGHFLSMNYTALDISGQTKLATWYTGGIHQIKQCKNCNVEHKLSLLYHDHIGC